jgi:NADH:ubiquinone oxidoreductase subunit 2 (subunit N)
MAINSVIGSYYYLRVIIVMYMRDHKGSMPADAPTGISPTAAMVVTVAVLVTLFLGLAPNSVLGFILSQPLISSH